MLSIKNLSVSVEGKEIVKEINLDIRPGEIHALMGPNDSGKSSLALALAGHPKYKLKVESEKLKVKQAIPIALDGIDITDKTPDERARLGLFLALQYPVGIEGVTVEQLLRKAKQECIDHVVSSAVERPSASDVNSAPPPAGLDSSASLGMTTPGKALDVLQFRKHLEKLAKTVGVKPELLRRSLNVGFSGGEKKRLEILQMLVLRPKYAILDETDSGLDVDALRTIAKTIQSFAHSTFNIQHSELKKPGILVITHYARLLRHLRPDFVHIMRDGRIVESGGKELAERIEKKGYGGNKQK